VFVISGVETITNLLRSVTGTTSQKTLEGWLQSGKSADDAFALLKFDKAGVNLLSSSKLDTWVTYMKAYNLNNPAKRPATMIKTFTGAYGDAPLAKILEAAKGVASTKKMAQELQLAQFNQWVMQGLKPDDVFHTVLKLKPNTWTTDPGAIILHQYNKFYKLQLKKVETQVVRLKCTVQRSIALR
jgi:hypothetical protein